MISRITLENFFSFGEPTIIELNPDINILVGINGSGKSNFLKAIHLLKEGIVTQEFEKVFLRDWSGFEAVSNLNDKDKDYIKLSFEFDIDQIKKITKSSEQYYSENPVYEITIFRAGLASYYLKEKLYTEQKGSSKLPYLYMEMENAEGRISTGDGKRIEWQNYPQRTKQVNFKSSELVLSQISDPDRYYPLFILKKVIEDISIYDYFDTTPKGKIRQAASFGTEKRLLPNGQNLIFLLQRMKNHHLRAYEKVEAYIRKVNPNIKDIDFELLGSKVYLVLREYSLTKSISIEQISNGTLRYLILLSILYNPECGNMVCLDEPEMGLHPDMINSIANSIKQASRNKTQLIIATHSPLLLNAFDLEEILIFEKDKNNQTQVSTKSEEDFIDWNDDYLSGQLWLQGELGGKRW